jgi:DNA-binding MarR family transcriptional regulator
VKQINRSAISQTVDILVARGLICRQQDALDRRNIPLELTDLAPTIPRFLIPEYR